MSYRKSKKQLAERALRGQGSTGGFSMAETLATVAIIVILLALAVVGIFNLYYSLQQKELDSKAEIIYVAAQDQMTKIMAAGRESWFQEEAIGSYQTSIGKIETRPFDVEDPSTVAEGSIYYITSEDYRSALNAGTTNAATMLFGDGGLDEELLNGDWAIEYDHKSLTVYAVFYCPEGSWNFPSSYKDQVNAAGSDVNLDRFYKQRLGKLKANEMSVGYHGGANSSDFGDVKEIRGLDIDIENDEKLVAKITCQQPGVTDHLAFEVILTDGEGNVYRKFYTLSNPADKLATSDTYDRDYSQDTDTSSLVLDGKWYYLDVTLDSLEGKSKRFDKQFGSGASIDPKSGNQRLVAGSSLNVAVRAFCPRNNRVFGLAQNPNKTTNSLFSDSTEVTADTITAHVAYGRHLQNLDSKSGVSSKVSSALVEQSVDFSRNVADVAEGSGDFETWLGTYGGSNTYFNGSDGAGDDAVPNFKPISNSHLKTLSSVNDAVISSLHIDEPGGGTSGGVGLLATVSSNMSISKLMLENPSVHSSESTTVGFVVGVASSSGLQMNNCQVYLDKDSVETKNHRSTALTADKTEGASLGGLIGYVSQGSAKIEDCSVSMVMGSTDPAKAEDNVGGLVGLVVNNAAVNINRSYSDSYLYGRNVAGLVASSENTSGLVINNSYAAGYLTGLDRAAGLVAKGNANVSRSYSICAKLSEKDTDYKEQPGYKFYTTVSAGNVDRVYYSSVSGATPYNGTSAISSDSIEDRTQLRDNLNNGTDSPVFVINTSETEAYNLMNQSLSTYGWPRVDGLHHYGDWESDFEEAALVYFERYEIGSGSSKKTVFRVEGGGIKDKPLINESAENEDRIRVVGDGYGLVYLKETGGDDPFTANVEITPGLNGAANYNETITVDGGDDKSIDIDGKYVIYPLDLKQVINREPAQDRYCLKATIDNKTSYLFNPHFARTVQKLEGDAADDVTPDRVYVRTARQLYNLSEYYSSYRDITKNATFMQQRNIDYKEYMWSTYFSNDKKDYAINDEVNDGVDSSSMVIAAQEPIGSAANASFIAKYDGGCHEITNIGFVAKTSGFAGMFGCIGDKSASVTNVVLSASYDPDSSKNYYVQCKENKSFGAKLSLGVLAGENKGTIRNCSVSGYYIAGRDGMALAYANSTLNIGGLVGKNSGTITKCSADFPKLALSVTDARTNAGGFVGSNEGQGKIKECYAIGAVNVVLAKRGKTAIAGFAASNQGQVSMSYCATALTSSGDGVSAYGFAPYGSVASSCTYLHNGTYSFVGNTYSYFFDTTTSAGSPASFREMTNVSKKKTVSKENTHNHANTVSGYDHYPYKGVVSDAKNNLVHYGDWQDDVNMGDLGVFYWEHEKGGSNAGYHMTYLGDAIEGTGDAQTVKHVQGTSLCTAHNDGGVIDSYGYGIYVQRGAEDQLSGKWDNIACSSGDSFKLSDVDNSKINREASEELRNQMATNADGSKKYLFYAFTTTTSTGGDFIRLDNSNSADSTKSSNAQNGTLSLKYKEDKSYSFSISPFFANAISVDKQPDGEGDRKITASDGTVTDYLKAPGWSESDPNGDAGNSYEIRSVDQLQYINWNNKEGSAEELVAYAQKSGTSPERGNWKDFNYLVYASSEKLGKSPEGSVVTASDIIGDSEVAKRQNLYWVQSHDVEQTYADNVSIDYFAPIAGTTVTTPKGGSYDAKLPTWFGSHYDGQSYTLRNISVKSDSFDVGIFGITVSADIKNVIMYGDDVEHAVIERFDAGSNNTLGSYSIGGLVGLAYSYDVLNASSSDQTITNCAISGYTVRDSSTAQQTLGEANVGGLIGVSALNLQKCSATATIELKSSHSNGSARWGNYIRVGGLTGAAQGTITDSYTGGKVLVDSSVDSAYAASHDGLLNWKDAYDYDKGDSTNLIYRIMIGGISGSAFTARYSNFVKTSGSSFDASPVFNNCYTYMEFPSKSVKEEFESMTTVGAGQGKNMAQICELAMYAIGSLADRAIQAKDNSATINNCYYYLSDQGRETFEPIAGKPYTTADDRANYDIYPVYNDLIMYSADSNSFVTQRRVGATIGSTLGSSDGIPKLLSYGQLASKETIVDGDARMVTDYLNEGGAAGNVSSWDMVTTVDANGGDIPGKFSFPASSMLEGKDYPFPTVIRQNDLTFGTAKNPVNVNVHYGDWPLTGISHWTGDASIDIFGDIEIDANGKVPQNASAYCVHDLYLDKDYLGSDPNKQPSKTDFKFCDAGSLYEPDSKYAEIVDITREGNSNIYHVKFRALDVGTTIVRLGNNQNASFTLSVTAEKLDLVATHESGSGEYNNGILTLDKAEAGSDSSATMSFKASVASGSNTVDFTDLVAWSRSVDVENTLSIEGFDASNANALVITRDKNGRVIVDVTATYNYQPRQDKSAVAIAAPPMHLTVAETGVVGLSAFPTQDTFCEAALNKDGNLIGDSDVKYTSNGPNYDAFGDENLFLYSTAGNGFFNSASIESVEIAGKSYAIGKFKMGDDYYITAGNTVSTDEYFAYRGLTVKRVNDDASDNPAVIVALKQNNRTIKLSCSLSNVAKAPTVNVTLGLASGGRRVVVPSDCTFSLPTTTYLGWNVLDNFAFDGWRVGSASFYYPGDDLSIAKQDVTLAYTGKKNLVLQLGEQGNDLKMEFKVGRGGISNLGEGRIDGNANYYDNVATRWFKDNDRKLTGWYASKSDDAVALVGADGIFTAGVADEALNIDDDGKLFAKEDVTLYAGIAIWTKATAVASGNKYLLVDGANQKLAKSVGKLSDKKTHGQNKSFYCVESEDVQISRFLVGGSASETGVVSDISDDHVWLAGDIGNQPNGVSEKFVYLQGENTRYYLSDIGNSVGNNNWYQACIKNLDDVNSPENSSKIQSSRYGRSFYTLNSNGVLVGSNRDDQGNCYTISFAEVSGSPSCLYVNKSGGSPASLYEQKIVFENPVVQGGVRSGK